MVVLYGDSCQGLGKGPSPVATYTYMYLVTKATKLRFGVVARQYSFDAIYYKLENRICRQIQDLHASFWYKRVEEP